MTSIPLRFRKDLRSSKAMISKTLHIPKASPVAMFLLIAAMAAAIACGSDTSGGDAGDNSAAAAVDTQSSGVGVVDIYATEGSYTADDFANAQYFKKSKNYDIDGLEGATDAIYGFYGEDPYDRQEFEVRFYPDHATAVSIGVDFANEATGPDAVIAEDEQRWDEGLVQRRACQGNTRGSHHSGKCVNAKYGDYVVMGNVVLLCQGKDAETALANCRDVYNAVSGG